MSSGRVATGSASSWNGLRVGHVALLCEEIERLPTNGEFKDDESEDATVLAGEGKARKSAGGFLLLLAM